MRPAPRREWSLLPTKGRAQHQRHRRDAFAVVEIVKVNAVTTIPVSGLKPAAQAPPEPTGLRPLQLFWLAGAVFVVSAGYGALMPLLPGWLGPLMPGASASEIARHVGLLSGVYAAGVLVGAPLWGRVSDHVGRSRILLIGLIGLIGHVGIQLMLILPVLSGVWGISVLRAAAGFFVAAVVPVVAAPVAEHTPVDRPARHFAWMSGVSLLGLLVGPALKGAADLLASLIGSAALSPVVSARHVLGSVGAAGRRDDAGAGGHAACRTYGAAAEQGPGQFQRLQRRQSGRSRARPS